MEQADRDKILNNIDKLMDCTEYGLLMDACLKNQLLYDVMRVQIEIPPSQSERHRKLLEKITHRGPTAYKIFEKILKENFPKAIAALTNTCNEISIRNGLRERSYSGQTNHATNHIIQSTVASSSTTTTTITTANQQSQTSQLSNASTTNHPPPGNNGMELIEFTDDVEPNVIIDVKYSEKLHGLDNTSKIGAYAMNSPNRGVFVLVNIINFQRKKKRKGADVDRDNLIYLFRKMKFKIFYYEDTTRDDFKKLIENLSAWNELRKYDCFVLAVLSHGDSNIRSSIIEFSDHQEYEVEEILKKFNNFHCKQLVGKPKIFIFPFCRGPLSDHGATCGRQTESDSARDCHPIEENPAIPSFFDMKICYATVPGYNAFRDPNMGSWYIEAMCKVFAEHAHDTHLEDLLKLIGLILEQRRTEYSELQTASNEDRGFTKRLFFNPGFYIGMDIEETV